MSPATKAATREAARALEVAQEFKRRKKKGFWKRTKWFKKGRNRSGASSSRGVSTDEQLQIVRDSDILSSDTKEILSEVIERHRGSPTLSSRGWREWECDPYSRSA